MKRLRTPLLNEDPERRTHFSILSSEDDLSGFFCCEKDLEEFLKNDTIDNQSN
jgi:hypothetical protein